MLAVLSQAEPGSLKVSCAGLARLPGRGVAGAGGAVSGRVLGSGLGSR